MSDKTNNDQIIDQPNPDGLIPVEQPKPDWQTLYVEQQAEIDRLKSVIQAGRLAPSAPHPNRDARPAITAEQLKAQVGALNWHKMGEQEKLAGLGLNPETVDKDFLKKCFGRGNDGRTASELMKQSPLRYRQLKEAAIALLIYAA